MAQPWLDDLSEDWEASRLASSPASSKSSLNISRHSIGSNASGSRIPRAISSSHKNRKPSSTSVKSLRPRSSRGLARPDTPVLTERSSSNLNVTVQQPNGSNKSTKASTIPRRVSSAFNNSVSSVQHHTINKDPQLNGNTPEWKRRLERGDKVEKDLFGPTPLEGIFHNPGQKKPNPSILSATETHDEHKPWQLPLDPSGSSSKQRLSQNRRSSKIMGNPMDVLEEDTNEGSNEEAHLALSPSNVEDSMVEESNFGPDTNIIPSRKTSQYVDDPRLRTVSGQEEIRNEDISPITLSKQNTLNERLLQGILGDVAEELTSKLQKVARSTERRPSSSASDNNVKYGGSKLQESFDSYLRPDFAELTSHSLPDDLSMGTDDFASRGGFVNTRRGGYSDDNSSFLKRNISSSADQSRQQFRSSPPPYISPVVESASEIVEEPTLPQTPSPTRPQNPRSSPEKSRSSGSPLKLFGDYDTYTKDRLSRRLSQFEVGGESSQQGEALRHEDETAKGHQGQIADVENPGENDDHRMSQFGQGDLNDYPFTKSMAREPSSEILESNDSTPSPLGTIFKKTSHTKSTSLPKIRKSGRNPVHMVEKTEELTVTVEITDTKRGPSSPGKERTPKRRRTLLQQELDSPIQKEAPEPETAQDKNNSVVVSRQTSERDSTQIAGQKRKDARYEGQGPPIDPNILASRQILRPKPSGTRQSSRHGSIAGTGSQEMSPATEMLDANTPSKVDSLTYAVANELASFRENFKEEENTSPVAQEDIRKPSITTQDYFAEATKVMELIRQNKRPPKGGFGETLEPRSEEAESSEMQEHGLVDDFTSTLEQFSRPPSREGGGPRPLPRKSLSPVNPRVISHLRKFEDNAAGEEDFDLDLPESDPPNLRIRAPPLVSSAQGQQPDGTRMAHPSSRDGSLANTSSSRATSSGRSIPTAFSGSSGDKGFITSENVNVPTQVGEMVFDEVTKSWVQKGRHNNRHQRKEPSEKDPFEDIPDLSVDELEEARRSRDAREEALASRLVRQADEEARPVTRDGAGIPLIDSSSAPSKFTRLDSSVAAGGQTETRATSWATVHMPLDEHKKTAPTTSQQQTNYEDDIERDIEVHERRVSKAPNSSSLAEQQPRVVTISFSSPVVSAVVYRDDSVNSAEEDPSLLDMEPMNEEEEIAQDSSNQRQQHDIGRKVSCRRTSSSSVARRNSIDKIGFVGRPVSTIDEEVEDQDMSLIHVPTARANIGVLTPIPTARPPPPTTSAIVAAKNDSSLISLTPLSEFTFHQTDSPVHLEHSYVASRAHPTSLQQAHGQLSLAVDDMVRAITDVEPYEPYWDHLRRLNLSNRSLKYLHHLSKYCPRLEELCLKDNMIGQVTELPSTLRTLDIRQNRLNELCAWSNLANLQYLDVSGNKGIETLGGFKGLKHLRELRVNGCSVKATDSFPSDAAWNGLLKLTLKGNRLAGVVDFEGAGLDRLTHLDLSQNNITKVRNLHCLPALTHLDISANQVETFESTKPLRNLQTLKLSWNQLKMIDLAMFPALKLLYLDGNHITSITGLECHRTLEVLSVRSQTPQGPASKGGLLASLLCEIPSDLRKLYLSANPLPQSSSGGLPLLEHPLLNLQYLDVASCGIASLPSNFGAQLPNLRALNLNFNALTDISPLRGVVRLNKLLCVGNRLQRMRRTVHVLEKIGGKQGARSLTKVDFRGNGVTAGFYVPWELWGGENKKSSSGQTRALKTSNDDIDGDENEPTTTTAAIYPHDKDAVQDGKSETKDPFTLPPQSPDADQRYIGTLDKGTRLKRGIWELLLMDKCPALKEVDGLDVAENWFQSRKKSVVEGDEQEEAVEAGIGIGNGDGDAMGRVDMNGGGLAVEMLTTDQLWVWTRLIEVGVLRKVAHGERAAAAEEEV